MLLVARTWCCPAALPRLAVVRAAANHVAPPRVVFGVDVLRSVMGGSEAAAAHVGAVVGGGEVVAGRSTFLHPHNSPRCSA